MRPRPAQPAHGVNGRWVREYRRALSYRAYSSVRPGEFVEPATDLMTRRRAWQHVQDHLSYLIAEDVAAGVRPIQREVEAWRAIEERLRVLRAAESAELARMAQS